MDERVAKSSSWLPTAGAVLGLLIGVIVGYFMGCGSESSARVPRTTTTVSTQAPTTLCPTTLPPGEPAAPVE